MKFALATAFAAFTLAGSAFADTRVTVTLDAPQPTRASFMAAHAVWNCAGATCVATAAPEETYSVDGCKDIAKQLGHVAAFTGDAKSLDSKALDRCNKSAAVPALVGTASR